MDSNDDVDEDELALAMSTELSRPARTFSDRRTRSFTSLRDAEVILSIFANLQEQVDPSFLRLQRHTYDTKLQLTGFEPKPIRIRDRSLDNQDKDNPDGLWASSVTVTEPSMVKGNQGKGLQAVSGYVGSSCSAFLVLTIIVWLCTVETFEAPLNNIRRTILIAQGRILKAHKRYSEFFSLRQSLCSAYPRYEKLIPELPPKSVVCTV